MTDNINKTYDEDKFNKLVEYSRRSGTIDQSLYAEYDVKRGLRESNGKGVLTGLTEISDVVAFKTVLGRTIPDEGSLFYQGYNINDLVEGFADRRYGFEEITYLLLFGKLPTREQLDDFVLLLDDYRALPDMFVRDIIMKAPNNNMMNVLQRGVLTLYSYDENPDDTTVENVLKQSLHLIAKFPLISVYGYQTYRHYFLDQSLIIRNPQRGLSSAENLLRILRSDGKYTELEAKVLDVALVLHADHGGGNNSTFTTHVVSSTGTDTYSAIAASLGSLKGPRHGGANIKVQQMFADIKENVQDWTNEDELSEYLLKILHKEAFDRKGLIYGMGHAVYTLSDPREVILKKYARSLAEAKGRMEEFELYDRVERLASTLVMQEKTLFKNICANVDFYSGFVYNMLGLPDELFTPLFAISRISGWCAHRMEEIVNSGKIIRPAYKYVGHHVPYIAIDERTDPTI
ncbi:MAG: citrate/2-methylcitrate synthase [Lachnospiraceae bacterium]|nr:citrate/2-methylcitrate synthase [Lachnospiraceae bacterium]